MNELEKIAEEMAVIEAVDHGVCYPDLANHLRRLRAYLDSRKENPPKLDAVDLLWDSVTAIERHRETVDSALLIREAIALIRAERERVKKVADKLRCSAWTSSHHDMADELERK